MNMKTNNFWQSILALPTIVSRSAGILMIFVLLISSMSGCKTNNTEYSIDSVSSPEGIDLFHPTWESIAENYQIPEWFKDAKFGIFIHWGPYSVPAYGNEWYPRNMYLEGHDVYNHHRETWGAQDTFGYKDFIPLFTAEKFNAEEWIEIFKRSGAKYIVPVAEHHDGFAMYDSDLNEWNAVDMGPRRDIIAELKKETEKAGLYFGVSSHRLENAWFFNGGLQYPSDVQDSTITLYGDRAADHQYSEDLVREWLTRTYELMHKYRPQLFWFDWTVNNPSVMPYFNRFLAHYYNCAVEWGTEVLVNAKQGYPTNVLVWDMERGKSDKLMVFPWQTDTSIGKRSWSYIDGEDNKSATQIIHDMIDIVSKNGNLLLNVGPHPDGSITDEQKAVLLEIGEWLDINGEAIYGTRPWKRFGEGPTVGTVGTFTDHVATDYSAQDIRFTTKGNDFYAIVLNWSDKVTITSLTKQVIGDSKLLSVSMSGSEETLEYKLTDEGLQISFPQNAPCSHAYSFKLTFDAPVGDDLESEASNQVMRHG